MKHHLSQMKHTTCLTRDKWALVLKIGCNNTKPPYNYSDEKAKKTPKNQPQEQESQVAKIQLELPHSYWINLFISGSTTNNCHFCNILATLWTGFTMQRASRSRRQTTLGLSLACWRTCSQEQPKAKQTIKLCKASDAIPSNAILLTAELSLIALTFAQSGPLPSPNSSNKPMVIASSRLR